MPLLRGIEKVRDEATGKDVDRQFRVTQFAKDEVELAGLVKFDFLGLKTLTMIDQAVRLVNKRIVAAINAAGAKAVGFSGADGRTIQCRLADPELGFVGEPVLVDPAAIEALRSAGIIPVISPIGCVIVEGAADQLVNINADIVAGNVAAAVNARSLVFLTDVEGVRGAAGTVEPSLAAADVNALIESGVINGGMIPKVESCLHAVALGTPAQIVDGRKERALTNLVGSGTLFPI